MSYSTLTKAAHKKDWFCKKIVSEFHPDPKLKQIQTNLNRREMKGKHKIVHTKRQRKCAPKIHQTSIHNQQNVFVGISNPSISDQIIKCLNRSVTFVLPLIEQYEYFLANLLFTAIIRINKTASFKCQAVKDYINRTSFVIER